MTIGVWLAGEGANELGGWADRPPYRDPAKRGVLVAFIEKIRPSGWTVVEAFKWKDLPKYRAGGHRGAEHRAVLGLIQRAKERQASAIVFARDRDGDLTRAEEIATALSEAASLLPGHPPVVGGIATERLESWVLATCGVAQTEGLSNANVDHALSQRGVGSKDTSAMVVLVDSNEVSNVPQDAASLRDWLAGLAQLPR